MGGIPVLAEEETGDAEGPGAGFRRLGSTVTYEV